MTKITKTDEKDTSASQSGAQVTADKPQAQPAKDPSERGGPKGPEPTRFGDWESGGRCTDF